MDRPCIIRVKISPGDRFYAWQVFMQALLNMEIATPKKRIFPRQKYARTPFHCFARTSFK